MVEHTYYFVPARQEAYSFAIIVNVMKQYSGHLLLLLTDITKGRLYYPLSFVRKYSHILNTYYRLCRKGLIREEKSPDTMYNELVRYIRRTHRVNSVVFDGVLGRRIVVEKVPVGALKMKYLYLLVNMYRYMSIDEISRMLGISLTRTKRLLKSFKILGYIRCSEDKCIVSDMKVIFRAYNKLNTIFDGVNYSLRKLLLFIDPDAKISIQEYMEKYAVNRDGRSGVHVANVLKKIVILRYVRKYAEAMGRQDTVKIIDRVIGLLNNILKNEYDTDTVSLRKHAVIRKVLETIIDDYVYMNCSERCRNRVISTVNLICMEKSPLGAIFRYHGVCDGRIDELEGIARYMGIDVEDKCSLLEAE